MRAFRFVSLCALCAAGLLAAGVARAAVTLNLTTTGASGTISSGGVSANYRQVSPQPTGTGYIDPFVRVRGNTTTVQAYNTTVNNTWDNTSENNYNHEITVGQVGFTTEGGAEFMRFVLDINQTGSDSLLNLDDVQIFISNNPNQSTESTDGSGRVLLAGSTLVYRQDEPSAGNDNLVTLDYNLNSGSGSGDMWLDIPRSAFETAFAAAGLTTDADKNGAYIYLYSKFGSPPNGNNDGFEEWAHTGTGIPVGCSTPPCGPGGGGGAPEPGSLALLSLALGLGALRCRRWTSVATPQLA